MNGARAWSITTANTKATAALHAGSSSPTALGSIANMSRHCAALLPGTRFAVEAYVRFVREKTLLEAIASSLTEMFSPVIIGERMAGMLANYDFVTAETLSYFDKRRRRPSTTPISRSITSNNRPRHPNNSRPCWPRSNSNAACCGLCWTRFITPMWRRSRCRRVPSR